MPRGLGTSSASAGQSDFQEEGCPRLFLKRKSQTVAFLSRGLRGLPAFSLLTSLLEGSLLSENRQRPCGLVGPRDILPPCRWCGTRESHVLKCQAPHYQFEGVLGSRCGLEMSASFLVGRESSDACKEQRRGQRDCSSVCRPAAKQWRLPFWSCVFCLQ